MVRSSERPGHIGLRPDARDGLTADNVKHYLRHAKGQRNQARNYARRRWTWNIEDDLR
jgi:hypothetical protein